MMMDLVLAIAITAFLYLRWKMIQGNEIEETPTKQEYGVEDSFLNGAEVAFNMIVKAYHEKDQKTLEALIDNNLVDIFMRSTPPAHIPSLESARIISTNIVNQLEEKSVEFDSRDENGMLIRETWVFAKPVGSDSSEWKLVRT